MDAGDQPDVGGGAEVLVDGEGSQRPSTASSDSEPFEVIDANSVGEQEMNGNRFCILYLFE